MTTNQTKNKLLNRLLALEDQFGSKHPELLKVVDGIRNQVHKAPDDLKEEELAAFTISIEGACDMLNRMTDSPPEVNQMMVDMEEFFKNPDSHPELKEVEKHATLTAIAASIRFSTALINLATAWVEYADKEGGFNLTDEDKTDKFIEFIEFMLAQLCDAANDAGNYLRSMNINGPKEAVFMMNVLAAAVKEDKEDVSEVQKDES